MSWVTLGLRAPDPAKGDDPLWNPLLLPRWGRHLLFYSFQEVLTMLAEILSVGTELLMGQIANTDAQYISRRLSELGVTIYRHVTVGDNPARVKEALGEALSRADIVIATGGTSDMPVAEEAALTAEALGNEVVRLYDVGVAGLHRLLAHAGDIMNARVIVAIAGMEGALTSVIGGLADCPVIAVPTSVGYGAAFGGLAALLSMLNSCASGVSVVNIDNGFGAGFLASRINHIGV